MKPDTVEGTTGGAGPVDHPALGEALVVLARSLDRRQAGDPGAPSYLDLAGLVADVQSQLEDLTRLLVHYARRYDGTTWKDVADAFAISRPTVYKRFGEPSPNDPGVADPEEGGAG
ncbi:MAG: hypothetical protein M3450_04445 [Actinomycetota bacterium]|nr:hypothetical protein [Actinomycetota bacterium]MDQ3640724.1 hypothetical protein [Actinomycetota bacterium]